jgi:hypothetical protein
MRSEGYDASRDALMLEADVEKRSEDFHPRSMNFGMSSAARVSNDQGLALGVVDEDQVAKERRKSS